MEDRTDFTWTQLKNPLARNREFIVFTSVRTLEHVRAQEKLEREIIGNTVLVRDQKIWPLDICILPIRRMPDGDYRSIAQEMTANAEQELQSEEKACH